MGVCTHFLDALAALTCKIEYYLVTTVLNHAWQIAVLQASPPSPALSSAQCFSRPLPSQPPSPPPPFSPFPPFPITLSHYRHMALNKTACGLGPTELKCFMPKATVKLPP